MKTTYRIEGTDITRKSDREYHWAVVRIHDDGSVAKKGSEYRKNRDAADATCVNNNRYWAGNYEVRAVSPGAGFATPACPVCATTAPRPCRNTGECADWNACRVRRRNRN